ncbi:MAG TPA: asparagine synthase (glutamine-hydrolyzing) [Longimicrobiales bacterium]|nr:asparagine synthase (glutamine-hydrolyzing) [Longimicrobiales bacterium]
MCGICGIAGFRDDDLLDRMTAALVHRGPDSAGHFRTDHASLGHRRLSIIDVSGGQQPILSEDGSVVIICNGEIYNFRELREDLHARGHQFRTNSDSEVILHLYEEHGPEGCLRRLTGMFAFALYDTRERLLFVARDRLGIKPLYYMEQGNRFLFASESKAILRYGGFEPTLDPSALHQYLALRYVPGPGGMFREIRKLPAAHYAVFRDGALSLHRYWTPELCAGPFRGSADDYLEGFADHFERSIQRRLISEVPLGAYLSGGLDSSVIVGAMSRITSEPVRTFTVGFDFEHDELEDAAETARMLGCRHTEVECRVQDVSLLPDIVYHLDEPIGDAIVIPMYLLAREAKKQVTVVLSGEGADEILGGYLFHKVLSSAHRFAQVVPLGLRRALVSPTLSAVPAALLDRAFSYPGALGQRGKQKLLDLLELLEPQQLPDAYAHLISLFDRRDTDSLYTEQFRHQLRGQAAFEEVPGSAGAPWLNRLIHLQFEHWLPDDILMKQDKMSMASGIEARVPFLDHELVEYALRIPPDLKIRRGVSKYILRSYAERLLPRDVASRPKRPFYAPVEKYLEDPAFRDLLEDTLSERSVRERGLFRPDAIARLRRRMHAGEFVYVKQVFSLIVLELWFRMAVDRRALPEREPQLVAP